MRTIKNFLFFLLVTASFSCEDIIEEDITNDNVIINYPQNNEHIESNVVNFQWNALGGASNYRIQVISSNQNRVLDSLVSGNQFTHSLSPGTYQWRIRAENFAYQTAFTFPISFTLVETSNLTNQQVILNSPSNNFYTQNTTPTFSWTGINAAENYTLQIVNITSGNNIVHEEAGIIGTSFTPSSTVITQDALYLWKVKGTNSISETAYSTRMFYIDRVSPNQPQNSSPSNEAILNDGVPVNFTWTAPNDTGAVPAPIQYTIQIATDQGFSNVIQSDTIAVTSYQYTFSSVGTYYWRIRATDLAGNQGSYSSYFQITVQ